MFRSRARKIFRDLWSRKGRTALASVAIFIGVLGVVTLVSVNDLVVSQLREDLKEDELAMQQVFVTLPGETEVDNETYIAALEALPGVTKVEGRAVYPLFWKRPSDEKFSDGLIRAASEPFGEIALQPMRLTAQGRYPVAGQKEIAIEKRMADKFGLQVGDELVLRVLSGGAAQEETWTITGVVLQPYPFFSATGPVSNETSVFATFEDAQYIAGFTGFSVLYVRYIDFATAQMQGDNFTAAMARETPYVPVFSFVDDPAENIILTVVSQVTNVLNLLALIAMIVSGFLVVNVINTIVVEQKRQIGVMKSLGATRSDNFVMYVGVALAYGVIGVLPGILLGAFFGSQMAQGLASLAFTLIEGFSISGPGIVTGLVMGLTVPVLAAIIPVFLGTRVTILEAMTDLGISVDYGRGILARMIGALPVPITVRQGLSNLTRKKGRLALTGLTLTLAVAAFMGVFGLFFSMNESIARIFDAFGFQLQAVPNEGQDFETVRALILDNVDEVQAVYPGVGLSVGLEGYIEPQFNTSQISVTGFDPRTDSFDLELEAGTGWRDDPDREGIVLTSTVIEQLGKDVGDRVVLTVGAEAAEFEIIGVASFPFDQAFMEWQTLSRLAGFTLGDEMKPVPNSFLVAIDNADPSVSEVDEIIDQISEVLLAQGITVSFVNQVQVAEENAQQALIFGMIFSLTAAVMAAVGAIGLLATLSMSVFERQKEIGVMRSIGAGSLTIAGQFLVEGVLVGVIAWVAGAPLSYLLSQALAAALPFGISDISYPPLALVIGLIGMIVIATVSSLWPSISAARKTVSEIIRYQ